MSLPLLQLLDDELMDTPLGEPGDVEVGELRSAGTSYFYEMQGPPDQKRHVHLSTGL